MGVHDNYRIVGTAGHIDHGKSALVRALTGTDPDRLQEERERGITIDLGFAHFVLEDGARVGFIDVPGHEKFVKNMLAGIGGIDAVLFVVAADESVMPQTREHLAICELLGVRDGVIAITKCDLVDEEIAELVALEMRELLAGTGLAEAPIVHTSAESGDGLDQLRNALQTTLEAAGARADRSLARMPIDRVFTVRGFGTVVTGTLLSGAVSTGDRLELQPRGTAVTVRGLQVYGESVERAIAGQRTAVNLQGIDTREADRGDVLTSPGSLSPSYLLDARVDMLDGHDLEHLQRVRFHHGAVEALGRVAVLDADAIGAGGTGLVQVRLESPYACAPGDRFVIRRYSPMLTIGGGVVIDNQPVKHRRSDAAALTLLGALEGAGLEDRIAAIAAAAGTAGVDADHLRRRNFIDDTQVREAAAALVESGRMLVAQHDPLIAIDAAVLPALEQTLLAAIVRHHESFPLEAGLPKSAAAVALPRDLPAPVLDALVARMLDGGRLSGGGAALALPDHNVVLDESQDRLRGELIALYDGAGLAPPALDEALSRIGASPAEADGIVRLLLRGGELVRLRDDLLYSGARLGTLVDELLARYAAGESFAVADFKEWTGLSRKHAIPLLEYLDQRRITRRSGDLRVRV